MEPIVIVAAADENYAMPLCVALTSALRNISTSQQAFVFVIDGGISSFSQASLVASLKRARALTKIEILHPNLDQINRLNGSGRLTHATYLRILIPEILPARFLRALYIDSDVLVTADVSELWDLPFDNHAVMAVTAVRSRDNISQLEQYFGPMHFKDHQAYFNSGVMLLNLPVWREERLAEKALQLLDAHGDRCIYRDQDALNIVLKDRWASLEKRWNNVVVGRRLRFDQSEINGPSIYHFVGPQKPWHWDKWGPLQAKYASELQQSSFYSLSDTWKWKLTYNRHRISRYASRLVSQTSRLWAAK